MVTSRRTVNAVITVMVILVIGVLSCIAQENESPFQIIQTGRVDNTITLECRFSGSGLLLAGAFYFLNGTRLENFYTLTISDRDEVTFTISREDEGHFACGNGSLMSNSMSLIAYPDSTVLPLPPPTYAIIGERVKLNCTVNPGRLLQQYGVTWDKSGTAIYQTRRNNSPLILNNRYSINSSDLSLIINTVQFEDNSDNYHCVFTVFDPNVMQSRIYTNMQNINIQLIVLGNFSRINVKITDRHDVVIAIELGVTYMQEVRLSLAYTNATNPMLTKEVVTSIAFRNASNITHIEFGGQVPFKKFSLRVRLMFSDGTFGPYNDVHGEYDINQATECLATVKIEKLPLIIIGVVLGVIILITITIIVILSVTLYCLKKGKTKVIEAVKEGDSHLSEKMDAILAAITSCRIAPDSGSPEELVDIRAQKALTSFISDSLSAAMENPQIRNEVKKSVAPVIKKYCQDVIN